MSDNKKYYYLKLKENFFDSEEIKILESMDNGYKYSNILLKMYLKSLKKEGLLMFKNSIPYNPKMIATVTDHNINDVKQALQLFQDLELIEILSNGAIYMMDIQNFIGSSSSEADRVRAYRNEIEKKKEQLLEDAENVDPHIYLDGEKSDVTNVVTNVQQKNDISTPERELKKEKELKDKEKDNKDKVPVRKIFNMYNEICKSLSNARKLSDRRRKHIKARWKEEEDLDIFKEVFTKAENSSFMSGNNDRDWEANLDWIIKNNTNFNKILEGKYDDKDRKNNLTADIL